MIILCIALLVACCAVPLQAQDDSVAVMSGGYRSTLPPESFMLETSLQLRGGKTEAGRLLECGREGFFLLKPGGMTAVPETDVLRLTLPGRKHATRVAMHGMLLGSWIGAMLLLPQENSPGSYADAYANDASPVLIHTLLIAAAAGGLSYLVGSAAERGEELFDFTGDDEARLAERARLEEYLRPESSPPRLHVTAEMAEVHPVERSRMDALLEAAGRPPAPMYQSWEGYEDSPFTFFRKLQLTYTAWPEIALGAAYMDLAEPQSADRSGTYYDDVTHVVSLEQHAEAWYAVGTYEPLRTRLHRSVAWLLGAGIGRASLRGTFIATTTKGSDAVRTSVTHRQSLDRGLISALFFSDFRVYLYSSLSLALTGEYVYLPRVDADAVDGLLPHGSRFDFSSWSWGIALGVHF